MFSHSVSFQMLRSSSHQPPRAMSTDPAVPSVISSEAPDFLLNARDVHFTFISFSSIKLRLLCYQPPTPAPGHTLVGSSEVSTSCPQCSDYSFILKNWTFNFSNDHLGTSTSGRAGCRRLYEINLQGGSYLPLITLLWKEGLRVNLGGQSLRKCWCSELVCGHLQYRKYLAGYETQNMRKEPPSPRPV